MIVDSPVMCRQATATGSSWNETWNWRCTYSLGISGYGHFSLRRNSWAMPGWSSSGRVVVPHADPPVGVLADAGDPALVHRADQRREPVGVELDEREVQVGEALGHAAADQLADELSAGRSAA